MAFIQRSFENPILVPESERPWEADGAFNGCVLRETLKTRMLYRAQSLPLLHEDGHWLSISSIGYIESLDGLHFKKRRQFIEPSEEWDRFGCEDPRVTKLNGKYYIFYTALSLYPFRAEGISVGLAMAKDWSGAVEKRHITPFNAKAMALFPEKIDGKMWAILTADTDMPPAKIALASFDQEGDLWDEERWKQWYKDLDKHTLNLQRSEEDHIEVGAPPVKTDAGWLLFYSYIQNYRTDHPVFTIEAVLLDAEDPTYILGHTKAPILVAEEEYERYGKVRNIIFPTGALIRGRKYYLYYGSADTTTCMAVGDLGSLLHEMTMDEKERPVFQRFGRNPLLEPVAEHGWENKSVFNPAVVDEKGIVRLLYRAVSEDDTSVFGYAETQDGETLTERWAEPVYTPRASFEQKLAPGNSGCEDARLTRLGDRYYMIYTAVDAQNPPRVALASIKAKDFIDRKFETFSDPVLISPAGIDDKDACLFPEKIRGKYAFLHRIQPSIDINFFDSLEFDGQTRFLYHHPFVLPRRGMWDSRKIGINTVPIKTSSGWLVLYHGVSADDSAYRLGALLLDLKHPEEIRARSRLPLFEPVEEYERVGVVPNVVFPCGAVVRKGKLIMYYGGADRVIGMASMPLHALLYSLASETD